LQKLAFPCFGILKEDFLGIYLLPKFYFNSIFVAANNRISVADTVLISSRGSFMEDLGKFLKNARS